MHGRGYSNHRRNTCPWFHHHDQGRSYAQATLHGTGVGLVSGNEYVINDNLKIREVTDPADCAFKYQDVERVRLISKGSLPNQMAIIGLKLSQNKDCQFESEVTAETDCRG